MADLRDLANRLTDLSHVGFDAQANQLKIKVATEIVRYLVRATPVDTSQAISNWQVTLGVASSHIVPAIVKGRQGSTFEVSADQALEFAIAVAKTAKPGQSVWISNKLPYIRRLNDGYSSQAPAGFVEAAQLIGRKIAEQGL